MSDPLTPQLDAASHAAFPIGDEAEGILTLRAAGDMRQAAVRQRLLDTLGTSNRIVSARQVHSLRVIAAADARRAAAQAPAGLIEADGLVSDQTTDALLVTVADCLPIYLASSRGALAIVHSGWRGTGIVLEALRMLQASYDAPASSVTAVIGPGIGACCYHVDESRAELFRSRYGTNAVRQAGGRPHLDLRRVNEDLLSGAGVAEVSSLDLCTSCTPQLWSSRRDGGGVTCRLMAAIIRRRPR